MHYTRYVGQYSVKRRGMRRIADKKVNSKVIGKNRTDYRLGWAKLIWKVYGMDPLHCPHCGSEMEIYDIITDNVNIHLKRLNIKVWYYNNGENVNIITKRAP